MQSIFTIDFFIQKFNNVPDEYCGLSKDDKDFWEWLTEYEAEALYTLIEPFGLLVQVNDGVGQWASLGETPKQRVIQFLLFVKRQRTERLNA